ncbi:hypothetical protein [Pantoea stewartii]|uniref:hypothetical protein n=1 Tax=Pantoea stewartii TaxID=66269 RepID=UPI0037038FB0
MAQLTNIQIRPAQVAGSSTIRAAWDDGKTAAFTCPEEAAQIISELAVCSTTQPASRPQPLILFAVMSVARR